MSGESSDPFGPAKDNLRDTIKWLATALGALAVALLAGLSLGSLTGVEGRALVLALGGAVLGVGSVSAIIWIFLILLIPEPVSLETLLKNEKVKDKIQSFATDILPAEIPSLSEFLNYRKTAIQTAINKRLEVDNPEYKQASDFIKATNGIVVQIAGLGSFEWMLGRLKTYAPWLLLLLILTVAGLVTFVVSAGSGKSEASGPAAALPVELAPGPAWAGLAQAFAGTCGDVAAIKGQIVGVPQPGWVELKLLAPEACAGLSLAVPVRLTASPAAPVGVPAPAGH